MIAVVVLLCSLAFLCYFIYSWVSCYMKKPRVREDYAANEGVENPAAGEGYDMRQLANIP